MGGNYQDQRKHHWTLSENSDGTSYGFCRCCFTLNRSISKQFWETHSSVRNANDGYHKHAFSSLDLRVRVTVERSNHWFIVLQTRTRKDGHSETVMDTGGTKEQTGLYRCFKISQGKSIIGLQGLFTLDKNNKGTRGHTLKLSKMRCTRDCWKYFF